MMRDIAKNLKDAALVFQNHDTLLQGKPTTNIRRLCLRMQRLFDFDA